MKKLKSILISRILSSFNKILLFSIFIIIAFPVVSYGLLEIDINSPSERRWKVAIPDFKNFSSGNESPELSGQLTKIISGDLDLSSYFLPMDKNSFLDEDGTGISSDNINFRNWTLIGTEVLIKGSYRCIGRNLEVNVRVYDPILGRQVFGKRFYGKTDEYRQLMHRVGNEIIVKLLGAKGIFLSKFLFVNTSTGNKEIYICDFDGYNIKKLTSDKSIALFPRWSPVGDRFAFTSFREGIDKLYYMDFSSGLIKKISGNREGLSASWTDRGESLDVVMRENGNADIYNINLDGKIIKKLTTHWSDDISPSRSPDGKKMVFVSDRSGTPQIYIKDLITDSEERVTFDLNECTSPVWSSLNRIAFDGITGGKHDIYIMNPDGSGLKQLTDSNGNNEDPCWSPDGRYIVFSSSRSGGYHLYIMNANGYNQRRITYFRGEETAPSWSPLELDGD
jgi:TolB protein